MEDEGMTIVWNPPPPVLNEPVRYYVISLVEGRVIALRSPGETHVEIVEPVKREVVVVRVVDRNSQQHYSVLRNWSPYTDDVVIEAAKLILEGGLDETWVDWFEDEESNEVQEV